MDVVLSHDAVDEIVSFIMDLDLIHWEPKLKYVAAVTRALNAHETTAVEPFAIALLCGDVRCDVCIPDMCSSS